MPDKVDVNVKVKPQPSAAQDTGNPVLDSLENLLAGDVPDGPILMGYHKLLLELAAKEPGGLHRRRDVCMANTEL
jgi:hypothetical protein